MTRQVRKEHGGGGWASHSFSVCTLDFTLNEGCRQRIHLKCRWHKPPGVGEASVS